MLRFGNPGFWPGPPPQPSPTLGGGRRVFGRGAWGGKRVGVNPDLQVEGGLPGGVLFTRGALEGVVAAGGEVDGAFVKLHCRTNALGKSYPGGAVKGK